MYGETKTLRITQKDNVNVVLEWNLRNCPVAFLVPWAQPKSRGERILSSRWLRSWLAASFQHVTAHPALGAQFQSFKALTHRSVSKVGRKHARSCPVSQRTERSKEQNTGQREPRDGEGAGAPWGCAGPSARRIYLSYPKPSSSPEHPEEPPRSLWFHRVLSYFFLKKKKTTLGADRVRPRADSRTPPRPRGWGEEPGGPARPSRRYLRCPAPCPAVPALPCPAVPAAFPGCTCPAPCPAVPALPCPVPGAARPGPARPGSFQQP